MPSNHVATIKVDVHISRAFYLLLWLLRAQVAVANFLMPRLVRVRLSK